MKVVCIFPNLKGFTLNKEYQIHSVTSEYVLIIDDNNNWRQILKDYIKPIIGDFYITGELRTFYFDVVLEADTEKSNEEKKYKAKCINRSIQNFTVGKIYDIQEIIDIDYKLYYSVIDDKGIGSVISAFCFDLIRDNESDINYKSTQTELYGSMIYKCKKGLEYKCRECLFKNDIHIPYGFSIPACFE